jgi:multicomponent Na+:H+ antiporter subunit D
MFVPTVALIAAALAIGLIPGMADGAQSAAERFTDGPSYAHAVIEGTAPASLPSPPSYAVPGHAYLYAAITFAASIGFAAIGLFGRRSSNASARSLERLGSRMLASLRALHSGHIGDYVAWLVAGVAALGGAFAIAFA